MSDSAPHPDPTYGPSRSSAARRHQQQQQRQQQQQHHQHASQLHRSYPPSHTSQPSFSTGQYSMSPPTSIYSQPQFQHQYALPRLRIPQMSPPLPPAHSHPPPVFYSMGHSATPSQPPLMYAQPFHTSPPLQYSGAPSLAFDYEGAWNSVPSPSTPASSPYLSQQPLTPFSFRPSLTATPQFTHSPPFPSPFPAHNTQQSQRTQYEYPPPYVTRTNPTTSEGARQPQQQPFPTWWFIPPTSMPATVGPYPSMYYVDAYGNPSNPALGQSFQSLPSPSSSRSLHPPAFSNRDPAIGLDSGPGSGIGMTGGPHLPSEGARKSDSINTSSSQAPLLPSPFGLGETLSKRGHQQQQIREPQSRQNIHRSHLSNPPAQRSEWVMWIGNVPSDATHDELWRFCTRPVMSSISSPVGLPSHHQQLHQPPHLPAGLLSPSGSSSASDADAADASGVQSLFLMARSNCAFVNYVSAAHLAAAVKRFNGIQLRPDDPSCPLLVCRIRGKEEDLMAGVGAQRGTGMHTRWIRDQRERDKMRKLEKRAARREGESADAETSASEPPSTPLSAVMTERGKESSAHGSGRRAPRHSGSSGDTTTSGFLEHHFPKRYFILKSLTQHDLDISVEKGGWVTQPHNETVLNQAFRNSSDVFLIFSVNRSGEFFGYARMASPVGKAADRVSWPSRTASQHSQHSHSLAASSVPSVSGNGSQVDPEENEGILPKGQQGDMAKGKERETDKEKYSFTLFPPSENRMVDNSPQPVTPATQKRMTSTEKVGIFKVAPSATGRYTAPPSDRHHDMIEDSLIQSGESRSLTWPTPSTSAATVMYRKITNPLIKGLTSETMDPRLFLTEIQLDSGALLRASREHELRGPSEGQPSVIDRVKRRDTFYNPALRFESKLAEATRSPTDEDLQSGSGDARRSSRAQGELQAQEGRGDLSTQWGSPFKVQWIRVKKLPFTRTRHLRNPWNHEREVKISRDGTELEPGVGQALLDEWDKEESPGPETTLATGGGDSAITASASAGGRRSALREDRSRKHRPPR